MTNHSVPPTSQQRDALDRAFGTLRSLGIARPHGGRWFAGVSAGLAERFGLDPLIVRAAFILGACLFGAAVPIYLIAWMLLPDDEGQIMVERAVREGHGPSVSLSILLAFVIINGFWIFGSWGSWGLGLGSVIVIGLVVWAIASGRMDTGSSGEGTDFAERLRTGWRATGWGVQSTGNRAAQAGASYRTGDGRIDLTKHDAWAGDWGAAPVAPVAPQAWTRPPRPPRRPRLGLAGVLIVGVALISGAVAVLVLNNMARSDDAVQVGLAVATGVVGLGLLIGGLLGRRGGLLALIGIPLAAASLLSLAVPSGLPWSGATGNRVWMPTSVAAGHQHSFALVAGDGTLVLTRVDKSASAGETLTTRVNVGNLKVVVPQNLTVHFTVRVDVGTVHLPQSVLAKTGDGSNPSGTGIKRSFTLGSGPSDLTVDARVGVGDLTVESR
ncbi:PspC domain-containing protein [Leekyejoonella antrihumi]|uniref:PspC domain-containing protein n=1 Tax=Leekyejoonella antrihumi TaxID=1660198 RepID=A0A563E1C0_9MICO|nr:PspC domain-containing protein [Leekyejoonella antrihumi]TWP35972.1 PspC domain-containing protein [Leekyejoonella antrihumi]